MTKINLYLDAQQLNRLNELRGATGVPVAETIRRAIEAYLEKLSKQKPDKKGTRK
jgi:predicted DNA-binding protein